MWLCGMHCFCDGTWTAYFRSLFFGNYINPEAELKVYNEVTDLPKLTEVMELWAGNLFTPTQPWSDMLCFLLAIWKNTIKWARLPCRLSCSGLPLNTYRESATFCSRTMDICCLLVWEAVDDRVLQSWLPTCVSMTCSRLRSPRTTRALSGERTSKRCGRTAQAIVGLLLDQLGSQSTSQPRPMLSDQPTNCLPGSSVLVGWLVGQSV